MFRNGPEWPGPRAGGARAAVSWTTIATGTSISFVSSYVNFDPLKAPRPGDGAYCRYNDIPVPCGPMGFAGGTNALYRNRGDGTFVDVSEASGIARPRGPASMVFVSTNWRPTGSYAMGAAAADFDNDGWPDIYVASDTAPSLLYRNNHDGTFREVGVPAGCAFDENGAALAGMGVGVGDFDSDGWLDIVRTNFSEQVTTLYRNSGEAFADTSIRAGLGVNRKYVGFGVGFFDFDNDGWKDLFIANGHVYSQIAGRKLHLTYRQPKIVYRNLGNGRFEDVSATLGDAIRSPNLGRGCAFGDFDNDGDVDVIVNNLDGPPSLLRNDGGNANNWIMIKCVGTRSNRSGIGTRVRVTRVRAHPDRRGEERVELLFAERLPPALRPGAGDRGRSRRDRVALRCERDLPQPGRQSPLRDPRVRGHRRHPEVRVGQVMGGWRRAGCWAVGAGCLPVLLGAAPEPEGQFTDITAAAGINFRHQSSATSSKYLVETMGGGVALFDYDNDGRLDVFFTNGARIDDPMAKAARPDKSAPTFWNRLYRQNGDGTFSDVTEKAGVTGMPQNYYGMGAAVGDYDNDGFADLYVTNYGGNTLYRNLGDGTFVRRHGTGRGGGRGLERQRRVLRLRQ